ncbi:hypothetical protein [Mitsuokella multacida]|uniref:hypothetical protein n=1 Tax=Mitsuokella multacida TaxID=52226 RepID=UPI0022E3C748|nr:hypothetical protein [Mitsuokella multacida]
MNEAKKDTKEEVSWNELVASIVSNTSMTVRDVQEMSYPELEELLEGISKNSKREKDMMEGIETREGTVEEFANFMSNGGF